MKPILTTLLLITALYAQAQIFATTTSGKKVILSTDGTWKYAEAGESEKSCAKNHTGNITIKNSNNSDVYFYYSIDDYGTPAFLKVKANSSKTISDLPVGYLDYNGKLSSTHTYKWKVLLEMWSGTMILAYLTGAIETGTFMLEECSGKEVNIGE